MRIAKDNNKELMKINNDNPSWLVKDFEDIYETNEKKVRDAIKQHKENYGIFKYYKKNEELSDIIRELNEDIRQQLNNTYNSTFCFDSFITKKLDYIVIKDAKEKNIKTKYLLLSLVKPELARFKNEIENILDGKNLSKEFVDFLKFDYHKDDKFISNLAKSLDNNKTNIIIKDGDFHYNDSKKYIAKLVDDYLKADDKNKVLSTITNYFFNFDNTFQDKSKNKKTNKTETKDFVVRKSDYIYKDENLKPHKLIDKKCSKLYKIRYHAYKNLNNLDENIKDEAKYWLNHIYSESIKEVKKPRIETFKQLEDKLIGKLKNIITIHIIDMGKIIDYSYDFDEKIITKPSLSSMDYQFIKFNDEFKQETHQYLMLAISAFLNVTEKGDLNKPEQEIILKNKKKLFAFFGGYSEFSTLTDDEIFDFSKEIYACLYQLRNDFMHKTSTKKEIKTPVLDEIINQEIENYGKYLFEKYKFNNVFNFYIFDDISKIIENNYRQSFDTNNKSAIPSFSKICHKSAFLQGKDEIFRGASYFLLKEIYNNEFRYTCSRDVFDKALAEISIADENKEAFKTFNDFIKKRCENDNIAEIYHKILRFFAETKGKKNIFVKIIFNKVLGKAFELYYQEKYSFILNPTALSAEINENTTNFDGIESTISIDNETKLWYVFFKFCSPNALTKMHGVIDSYAQNFTYLNHNNQIKNQILNNENLDESKFEPIYNLNELLKINQFLKLFCGRLSYNYTNYYENLEEFENSLKPFVDFTETLDKFQEIPKINSDQKPKTYIYKDGENPIVHSTIEHAKMYGIYNFLVENCVGYKVSKEEFNRYCESEFKSVDENSFKNKTDLEKYYNERNSYISLKNKVTLVDISIMSNIIFELYGKLISYQYRFERDQMYFLLGVAKLISNEDELATNLSTIKNVYIYGKNLDDTEGNSTVGTKLNQLFKINTSTITPFTNDIMTIDYLLKQEKLELSTKSLLKEKNLLNKTQNSLLIVDKLTDKGILSKADKTNFKNTGTLKGDVDKKVVDKSNNNYLKIDFLISENLIKKDIISEITNALKEKQSESQNKNTGKSKITNPLTTNFINQLKNTTNLLIYKSKFQKIHDKTFYTDIRNSIDHFVLFHKNPTDKNTDIKNCSILEFYNIMSIVFAYDRKVKNSVLPNFENILSRNFIDSTFEMSEDMQTDYSTLYNATSHDSIDKLFLKFKLHYKIDDENFKARQMVLKHNLLDENYSYNRYSDEFLNQVKILLKSKK